MTSQPPNGTTHFPTIPIISSPTCLQDLRPSPCDANDLQWQRHQQHLAYLKSLGSSKLSRYLTKGNDWLHKFAEVKPTAWQWKTQKEDFHRCQRPKRLRHVSLRLKSQSTPLLHREWIRIQLLVVQRWKPVESILKSVLLKWRLFVAFRWLLSRWMTLQWLQHPKVRFPTCWHLMLCVVFELFLDGFFKSYI